MGTTQKEASVDLKHQLLQDQENSKDKEPANDFSPKLQGFNNAEQVSKNEKIDVTEVKLEEFDDETNQLQNRDQMLGNVNGTSSGRKQFKSILKSSKNANSNDSFLVRRLDATGNEIKQKQKGVKSVHRITFSEQISQVNEVENWKKYNTDLEQEPSCGCTLI